MQLALVLKHGREFFAALDVEHEKGDVQRVLLLFFLNCRQRGPPVPPPSTHASATRTCFGLVSQ